MRLRQHIAKAYILDEVDVVVRIHEEPANRSNVVGAAADVFKVEQYFCDVAKWNV